jgi:hypothetical protein
MVDQGRFCRRILSFAAVDVKNILCAGWFSLNVPSGLCIYWLTNNIITTAQLSYLRNVFTKSEPVAAAVARGGSGRGKTIDIPVSGDASNDVALRRSRRGETFRARGQNRSAAVSVVREARVKRKGSKFKQRLAERPANAVAGSEQAAAASSRAGEDAVAGGVFNSMLPLCRCRSSHGLYLR